MASLTGRKRYRVTRSLFFGKPLVVLQHEVEDYIMENIGGRVEGENQKWWVDAAPEDVMGISDEGHNKFS